MNNFNGDWGLGPIPNTQSPIPNKNFCIVLFKYFKFLIYNNLKSKLFSNILYNEINKNVLYE